VLQSEYICNALRNNGLPLHAVAPMRTATLRHRGKPAHGTK
jgi:hypothetical protein